MKVLFSLLISLVFFSSCLKEERVKEVEKLLIEKGHTLKSSKQEFAPHDYESFFSKNQFFYLLRHGKIPYTYSIDYLKKSNPEQVGLLLRFEFLNDDLNRKILEDWNVYISLGQDSNIELKKILLKKGINELFSIGLSKLSKKDLNSFPAVLLIMLFRASWR